MKTFLEFVKEKDKELSDDYEFKKSKQFCKKCSKIVGKNIICCGKCKKE